MNSVLIILLLALLLFSASCVGEKEKRSPLSIESPDVVQKATAIPTSTPSRAPQPSTTPAASRTPVPKDSSNPIVAVYGPSNWSKKLGESIDSLNAGESNYHWELAQDSASANLIISTDPGDYPAGYRPLVLTVPITAEWDQLSLEEANALLLTGHPIIEVHDILELTPKNKAIKIDGFGPFDPNYPLLQKWSIIHEEGVENAAEELSVLLLQNPLPDPFVHLAAVGDIMLDRSLGNAIRNGNPGFPFEFVKDELGSADVTIGNLESSIGGFGEAANKAYAFQAPSEAVRSLADAGFDLLSLANNHAMDYGQEPLLQGIRLLQVGGIEPVGAGANAREARSPVFIDSRGIRLAFLSYVDVPVEGSGFDTKSWAAGSTSPGVNWADPGNIALDVRDAKANADSVIVLLHSGYEYVEQPSPEQSSAAHAAIDAGANLVIGHHSHILQGIHFYKSGVIAYGLGNFAFDIDGDPNSGILNIWLNKDGIRQLDLAPVVIQYGGQPRPANPGEAAVIRVKVNYLTDLLNNE